MSTGFSGEFKISIFSIVRFFATPNVRSSFNTSVTVAFLKYYVQPIQCLTDLMILKNNKESNFIIEQ